MADKQAFPLFRGAKRGEGGERSETNEGFIFYSPSSGCALRRSHLPPFCIAKQGKASGGVRCGARRAAGCRQNRCGAGTAERINALPTVEDENAFKS